jgi:hypothetical protein
MQTAFASLALRAKEASARLEKKVAETPMQMFLPGFDIGALPNHLNRSSLIAPIARGRRKFHVNTVMVSRADCVIEFTGEQLDEADGDILMALIYYAKSHRIGATVPLNRATLLKKIARSTGKQQYKWLHRRILALTASTLYLEAKKPDGTTRYKIGSSTAFHIVSCFEYNDKKAEYSYRLDPRWVLMFGNSEYCFLNWEKRMLIRPGQDMAKTLQRLVSTSSNKVQRYALDWLKSKMEYQSPMRKFKAALTISLLELERLQIIAKGTIEVSTRGNEQLAIWLTPSV